MTETFQKPFTIFNPNLKAYWIPQNFLHADA